MDVKNLKYPASKWLKHTIMWDEPSLQQHLPVTARFNKHSLKDLLEKFAVVFIKPTNGSGGHGIIKISRTKDHYLLQTANQEQSYSNQDQLLASLKQTVSGSRKSYLIQQGIDLIKINKRPIDFRILLLKQQEQWTVMGIMGKRAAKNKFVTNHCRGGTAFPLKKALAKSLRLEEEQSTQIEETMHSLALNAAKTLNQHFKNINELGFDAAIDSGQHIWLLEANTKPQFNLFRHHDDENLYHKIYRITTRLRNKP